MIALLTALAPVATARATSLPKLLLPDPGAGAELTWSDFEVAVGADLALRSNSYEPDFGTAGLTVTAPWAAADGESGGMVLCWSAGARDPAYLVSVTSLFSTGASSWIAAHESLWSLPDLGVVPGGNLSVFATGAVDVVSWNFLEFSCAMLALRLADYARLKSVLEPEDFDLNARIPGIGQELRAVPDPATSLLMGQGLLILALLVRISHRDP